MNCVKRLYLEFLSAHWLIHSVMPHLTIKHCQHADLSKISDFPMSQLVSSCKYTWNSCSAGVVKALIRKVKGFPGRGGTGRVQMYLRRW